MVDNQGKKRDDDAEYVEATEVPPRENAERQGKKVTDSSLFQKTLSIVVMVLAVLYDVSPIDAIPDVIPVAGWLDDFGFTAIAALNLFQQLYGDQTAAIVRAAKYAKWILIVLTVIAVLVLGGIVVGIVALIKSLAG